MFDKSGKSHCAHDFCEPGTQGKFRHIKGCKKSFCHILFVGEKKRLIVDNLIEFHREDDYGNVVNDKRDVFCPECNTVSKAEEWITLNNWWAGYYLYWKRYENCQAYQDFEDMLMYRSNNTPVVSVYISSFEVMPPHFRHNIDCTIRQICDDQYVMRTKFDNTWWYKRMEPLRLWRMYREIGGERNE